MRMRICLLGLAILLAALLPGCRGAKSELRGKWYDINSDAVLEVGRSRLTITQGKYSDSYAYRVEKEDGYTVLKGTADDYGDFGLLSCLTLYEDGSLNAYEMVLDGEGHHYRFVREEAMEAMLEIKDRSTDAPKEIESHEIRTLALSFRNYYGSYGLEDWPAGHYSLEVEPAEEGGWTLELRAMGSSYIALAVTQRVDEAWMLGLDRRIRDLDILQYNGYRKSNEVDRPGWSLQVEYASGERLSLSAGGSAAETCVFDLPGLMEYVRPLAEEALR